MEKSEAEALEALLQPLLRAFEVLFLLARHFHPPRFAGLMAQVGGKAAAPLEMLQLRATLPTKPEVDVRPIESLLPVVAPEAKLMEEDAGNRVNDGGVAVTIT